MAKQKAGGKLFVVSAPSGCGKTTLCKRLLADKLGLVHSVSMTTRRPRHGERDGVDYRFVSERRFREMIRKKGFLEYEDNFGELYGTPKKFIKDSLDKARPVLLSIDVKGAMKVRRAYPRKSVLVFLLPPSRGALIKRLRSRMSDEPHAISARLKTAKKEMGYRNLYDYRVINDRLSGAYRRLKNIIIREADR